MIALASPEYKSPHYSFAVPLPLRQPLEKLKSSVPIPVGGYLGYLSFHYFPGMTSFSRAIFVGLKGGLRMPVSMRVDFFMVDL